MRLRLSSDTDAARFFGGYSEVLELKNDMRTNLLRRPNYFAFNTPAGGVFLRCAGSECLIAEGATPEMFAAMVHSIGWSPNPTGETLPGDKSDVVSAPRRAPGNAWIAAVAARPDAAVAVR